eukprot:544299_1
MVFGLLNFIKTTKQINPITCNKFGILVYMVSDLAVMEQLINLLDLANKMNILKTIKTGKYDGLSMYLYNKGTIAKEKDRKKMYSQRGETKRICSIMGKGKTKETY